MALRYMKSKAPLPGSMTEEQRVDAEMEKRLAARRAAKAKSPAAEQPKSGFDALRSVLGEGYVPPPVKKKGR